MNEEKAKRFYCRIEAKCVKSIQIFFRIMSTFDVKQITYLLLTITKDSMLQKQK